MMTANSKEAWVDPRAQTAACSFDIFDTFLLRACASSLGVYERAFQLSPVSRSHPHAVQNYVQHRIQADNITRRRAKEKRNTSEVTIEDIYRHFPFRLFGLDRTALPVLVDAEFQAELDLCRVNEEILQLYLREQEAGKRVGFISDTYWGAERIATLLRHCQPGLIWDFLYASCDYGTGKSDQLFARYLSGQRINPATATHIGDNPGADIKGAGKYGIHGRFYPQASRALSSVFERETSTFNLLCNNPFGLLDHGYRTLRRIISARWPQRSPAFQLGLTTLGPALMGFDAFLENRIAGFREAGDQVAVAFLGRDGFLSHRIWGESREDDACFLEISRRVTLIGSANTLDPLIDLFEDIGEEKIDAQIFRDFLKSLPPAVAAYFASQPGQWTTGYKLASALPSLIRQKEIADIAKTVRTALLSYFESKIPGFRKLSDFVLIDIGYSGSIQKALRRIFDIEKLNIRIHGLYLSTHDEAFYNLADQDTAEGFISDLVLTPHTKRMFNRNVTMIEQFCCSHTGSVRGYDNNNQALYEIDGRPPHQISLAQEVQDGVLAFVRAARDIAPRYRLTPFNDLDTAARWSATIIARLLLLPTDHELAWLGSFRHDLNWGSVSIVSMVDRQFVQNIEAARGFPVACTAPAPPMWLGGSFASISPASAYQYMLFGANQLPLEVFSDIKCRKLQIGLFQRNGTAVMENVTLYRNANSDLRIHIPITRSMDLDTVVIPLAKVASEGVLRSVVVQHGESLQAIAKSQATESLPLSHIVVAGSERHGNYFRAIDSEACLILKLGSIPQPVTVLTLALSPLNADRIMASDDAGDFEDDLKAALFDLHGHNA